MRLILSRPGGELRCAITEGRYAAAVGVAAQLALEGRRDDLVELHTTHGVQCVAARLLCCRVPQGPDSDPQRVLDLR